MASCATADEIRARLSLRDNREPHLKVVARRREGLGRREGIADTGALADVHSEEEGDEEVDEEWSSHAKNVGDGGNDLRTSTQISCSSARLEHMQLTCFP